MSCKISCPKQIKILINQKIVFNSCEKDAWKNGSLGSYSTYLSFEKAQYNKQFLVSFDSIDESPSISILGGENCKKLKSVFKKNKLIIIESEYYPNSKECDKVPCISKRISDRIEI